MKRLALPTTVLLVLLAACGGGPEPVEVTGSMPGPAEEVPGESGGEPIEGSGLDWSTVRGETYRAAFTDLSDQRVNGDLETVMDIDISVDGDRTTAMLTITSISITNGGGTWEGSGQGTSTWTKTEPAHLHTIDFTLIGTGDYEGLQFTYQVEGVNYPWELTGTIEPVKS